MVFLLTSNTVGTIPTVVFIPCSSQFFRKIDHFSPKSWIKVIMYSVSSSFVSTSYSAKLSYGPKYQKYYDEIITKLNLHARERHEHSQDQTASSRKKKKKRILLVDDELDICMVYQMMLEDAGYECISYTDSVKALQEFKPYFYDLILLDIKMPLLNGFELCKKIREIDKTVHIIFITSSSVSPDMI
jgi:response regulator receiver domain-containing protein